MESRHTNLEGKRFQPRHKKSVCKGRRNFPHNCGTSADAGRFIQEKRRAAGGTEKRAGVNYGKHKPNPTSKINLRLRSGRTEHSSFDGGALLQPAYRADGKRGRAYAFYNGSCGVCILS